MYEYTKSGPTWDGSAVAFSRVLGALGSLPRGARILDAGCGNGYFSALLVSHGFESIGVDPSRSGIAIAQQAHPEALYFCLDLTKGAGQLLPESFDAITCIEVIEHVYAPRALLATLLALLKPGGKLIMTTPYHGLLKNLAVILSCRFDRHFNPLWDDGHIKFFSRRTLKQALSEAGFRDIRIEGIGRAPGLWKTMLAQCCRERR